MSKRKLFTKGVVLALLCAMNLVSIEPINAMASSAPSNTSYEEYTSMDMDSAEAFFNSTVHDHIMAKIDNNEMMILVK